ncbi:MAG: cell division protein FtsZ [bacterium]|nr:cell division protein FtsZ [bacterium]
MAKNLKKKSTTKLSKKAKVKKRTKFSSPTELLKEASVDEKIKKTKIRVIGIGGGGGNIVSEIASEISKASFVVANTDIKSLKSCSKKVAKFQFGQNLTHGLGTGMNPELGKAAAQSEKERIKKLLEGQDLCILVVCLGGGTGSGAVSTFAKISKNLANLTYGIFTLPFKFEGEKKMEIAINSLKESKNHLNIITIIPNERVFQIINKDTPLKEALSTINKFLSESLKGLIETIYEPGLINIDFADFKTILEGRGRLAYLNTIEAQRKEGAIKDIASKVLNFPLYPYTIRGAKGVLFNIAGEKNLSLSDVNQISKAISELVNPEAKIIFGISQHKKYSNIIKTVLLATGCGMKIFPSKTEPRSSGARVKKKSAKKSFSSFVSSSTRRTKFSLPTKKKKVKKRRKKKEEKVKKGSFFSTSAKASVIEEPPKENLRFPTGQAKVEKPKVETKEQEKTPPKKVKIRSTKKPKEEKPQESKKKEKERIVLSSNEEKVRKNGLQIKKEAEELEKEMIEKEKIWETPAFLRKKTN